MWVGGVQFSDCSQEPLVLSPVSDCSIDTYIDVPMLALTLLAGRLIAVKLWWYASPGPELARTNCVEAHAAEVSQLSAPKLQPCCVCKIYQWSLVPRVHFPSSQLQVTCGGKCSERRLTHEVRFLEQNQGILQHWEEASLTPVIFHPSALFCLFQLSLSLAGTLHSSSSSPWPGKSPPGLSRLGESALWLFLII